MPLDQVSSERPFAARLVPVWSATTPAKTPEKGVTGLRQKRVCSAVDEYGELLRDEQGHPILVEEYVDQGPRCVRSSFDQVMNHSWARRGFHQSGPPPQSDDALASTWPSKPSSRQYRERLEKERAERKAPSVRKPASPVPNRDWISDYAEGAELKNGLTFAQHVALDGLCDEEPDARVVDWRKNGPLILCERGTFYLSRTGRLIPYLRRPVAA